MAYQESRRIAFVIGDLTITALYCLVVWIGWHDQLLRQPMDNAVWASVLLVFIPVQILAKVLIIIGFAIRNSLRLDPTPVDQEDELDKEIYRRGTNAFASAFVVGVMISLGLLIFGLPLQAFFLCLGIGFALSGRVSDLATLLMYRRGI